MTTQELAEKLSRTHSLYTFRGFSSPADCAQDQLQGRTHYVDPSTLRFFKARILYAKPMMDGLFYWILESCAQDPYNESRGFRAVLFDLFGEVVYRPDFEGCRKTKARADADFQAWNKTFNPIEHYRQTLEARANRLSRDAETMREIFETETA